MSTGRPARSRVLDVGALALAGLALLAAAALLAPGGPQGTVRTVLGVLAVLVVPGWLVGRVADEEGDAVARIVGGTVVTLGVCALCGFGAFELGLRVATAVFAVPLLVLVAVAALLGMAAPRAPRASLTPLLAALGLGAAALFGAWGTHLALPAVPVEPAFSIEAGRAVASPKGVTVTVTVTQVRTDEPTELTLYVGYRKAVTELVPRGTRTVRLASTRKRGTPTCPSLVRVVAPNGAFLTPPVHCVSG
jgi:hypothetical protein